MPMYEMPLTLVFRVCAFSASFCSTGVLGDNVLSLAFCSVIVNLLRGTLYQYSNMVLRGKLKSVWVDL